MRLRLIMIAEYEDVVVAVSDFNQVDLILRDVRGRHGFGKRNAEDQGPLRLPFCDQSLERLGRSESK